MRTRYLLIGLALILLLLGLSRTLTDSRNDPVRPVAPGVDVEPLAPDAGPFAQAEDPETAADAVTHPVPEEAKELMLSGSVTRESDGEPLVGAHVAVYDRRPLYMDAPWLAEYSGELLDLRANLEPVAETRTEGLGTFAVAAPSPGLWTVVVSHPPLRPAACVMPTGEDEWFSLRESVRMSFQVVDEDDRPVAGARAFILDAGPSSLSRSRAVSDAAGRFEVDTCPRYDEMLIRAEGYADRYVEDLDEWVDEPIVLRTPYRIAGVVLDPEGAPVDGASVLLLGDWDELRLTGASGRFSFDRVGSGSNDLWLEVKHPRLGDAEARVYPGDEEVVVRFAAPSHFTLAGRFEIPTGSSPTRVNLQAWATRPGPALTKEVVGTSFKVTGTNEGTINLKATALRTIGTVVGAISLRTAEGSLKLTVARGSTTENVILRLEPMVESYVPLETVDEEGRPIRRLWFEFTSDDGAWAAGWATRRNGVVAVRLPFPAGTTVELRTGGRHGRLPIYYVGLTVSAVTTLEQDAPPQVVVIRRTPEFVLEARDENGGPLPPGAEAKFLVQQSHWSNYAKARRNDPRCAIAPLLPHEGFRVTARATGRASVCRSFGPPGAKARTIPIPIPPEGILRGRLLTAGGRPVARARLGAEVFRNGERAGLSSRQDLRPDGRFEVGGLCSGRVRLYVLHGGAFAAEVFADVVAGQVTDLGDVLIGSVPVLRGTVSAAGFRGLGGVEVVVQRPGTSSPGAPWPPLARTHTRRDGSFELPVPWRAGHEVIFSKLGYEELRLPFERKQFENPLTLTMLRSR